MPGYGNVPDDDVLAVRNAVTVAARIATQLPPNAPPEWREVAYQTALTGILDDWVANGTTELDEGDEQDITNLLRLAADTALGQGEALRDTTFATVAQSVMQDWVENWNADEDEE